MHSIDVTRHTNGRASGFGIKLIKSRFIRIFLNLFSIIFFDFFCSVIVLHRSLSGQLSDGQDIVLTAGHSLIPSPHTV